VLKTYTGIIALNVPRLSYGKVLLI